MNRKQHLINSIERIKFEVEDDNYSKGYNAALRTAIELVGIVFWEEDGE